ncbi:peptidylprolyl isomerase [uncultured Paraglaciecola sp.]|uniref:peptidylprolyl isomerase n=1 Tax=uncultured Paraglaciecola sp. TaxID=1765024 RepID=UPI0030D9CC34|tara:strand:+ start:5934 stop:6725 length:792 start_codon:yes stop_codon:yes gene_type:complete
MIFKSNPIVLATALLALLSFHVQSTIVEIRTSLGVVEVNLYDNTTPATVDNFLSYVNSGAYFNNVVHRSVGGFIVQAGGYQYNGPITDSFTLDEIETGTAVVNEPKLSNVRGTIAMAKLSNQANSATSEWFINLANNSANLDLQNSGFTVFGQVTDEGMQVIDAIAELSLMNAGGAFSDLPIRNYTQTDLDNDEPITDEHLVIISDVVVIDSDVDTAASLNPVANTLIDSSNGGGDSGSGGGAFGWLLLLGLALLQKNRLLKR